MKYMIISDLHGSFVWAQKILRTFEAEQADYLLVLGDLLYHGPRNPLPEGYDPQQAASVLNSISNKIIAVRGNCDAEVDQMMLDFPLTADYNILPYGNRKILLSHGHLFNERNLPKSMVAGDLFMYGHTHLPTLKEEGGLYLFNPGSVSMPKENHPHTYGVLEENQLYIKTFDGEIYRHGHL